MTFIEACRKFISIESTPTSGNKELALFAAQLCRESGLQVTIQEENSLGLEQINFVARPPGAVVEDELLLQTHLDTVDPGIYSLWTKTSANPFNASIYDDEIYGLGSANVKLDFLCKLEALKSVDWKKLKRSVVLAGTFGEENGMSGAIKLIRRKMIKAKYALIGEPTSLNLVSAGPGLAVVEANFPFSEEERDYHLQHDLMESSSTQSKMFYGRSAHSAHPQMGENAIVKMLDYLANLPEGIAVMALDGGISYNTVPSSAVLEIDMVDSFSEGIIKKIASVTEKLKQLEVDFQNYPYDGFSPPVPTMNIGVIRTSDYGVFLQGSCRLPPSVTSDIYEGWMHSLKSTCEEVGAQFRIRDYKQPFLVDGGGSFAMGCQEVLKELGHSNHFNSTSSCTEASVFSRLGVECLVFGPGVGVGNSHQPNEHVKISDLKKATEAYKKIIERICL